jgi:hypothetical protein
MMIEALKLILNSYCETVVPNLFKNSANIPAKKENIVSYPTHIINAVFTSASIYAYEHLNSKSKNSIRDLKLLMSIITLHDIGKYLEEKRGIMGGNTKENIRKYFKQDDFKIKDFFPELEEMIKDGEMLEEIVWLIQNTELRDEARIETLGHKTEFGKLADYSRLGDKVASLTKSELYASKIFDALKYHDVHVVQIPKFPQFLIRRESLKVLRRYYEEKGVIPFLLFEDGFFYIAENAIETDPEKIKKYLLENVKKLMGLTVVNNDNTLKSEQVGDLETNMIKEEEGKSQNDKELSLLSLRIDVQSIDDSSILNFPLSQKDKKKIILTQIIENIPKAMKGFTIILPLIPDDDKKTREIQEKISTIVYYIYNNADIKLILKKKPGKKELQKRDHILNDAMREKIKSFRDEYGSQKYKLFMAKELFENYMNYNIDEVYSMCDKFLGDRLDAKENVAIFDRIVKNISVDFRLLFEMDGTPKDKGDMCFLCGSKAEQEYRAGKKYFLQAREFSKRGEVLGMQKKICPLCLIEKNLIESLFKRSGCSLFGDNLFAIFYFDKIFANVAYFSREISNAPLEPQVSIREGTQFRLGDFDGLYYIVPYNYSRKEESARQSARVNITKQILDFIYGYGCKAILTYPYTLLRTYNELFVNENPIRLEMALSIATIGDFGEITRRKQFLDMTHNLDGRKGYYEVQSYALLPLIHYIKLKSNGSKNWIKESYVNVVKTCFGGEIMRIEEIAKKGKELYSTGRVEWESSYKRTVLMRTALDYILMGLQQRLPEEELETFVSGGLYKLAMREEYAKKKDADRYVKEFVECLIHYLKEYNWFSVPALSSIEKYLADSYEFALISLSKEKEK